MVKEWFEDSVKLCQVGQYKSVKMENFNRMKQIQYIELDPECGSCIFSKAAKTYFNSCKCNQPSFSCGPDHHYWSSTVDEFINQLECIDMFRDPVRLDS